MGRARSDSTRDRRQDRGNGGEHIRDGSDNLPHLRSRRPKGGRSAHRDGHVQNVGDRNDLADRG